MHFLMFKLSQNLRDKFGGGLSETIMDFIKNIPSQSNT